MNIYDIAKEANVSIATVSRVINKAKNVSEKTLRRVTEVMEKNNYVPSKIAQNLSINATFKLVGLICYTIDDLYSAKIAAVLEKKLREADYDLILCCTGRNMVQNEKSIDMLLSKNVDAIIFISSAFSDLSEKILHSLQKVPVFAINAHIPGDRAFCAYCDDYAAAKFCTETLIREGRQKLLYLYDSEAYSGKEKLKGFWSALESCGKDLEAQALKCRPNVHDAEAAFAKAHKTDRFDAVLCANDLLAAGVLAAAEKLKVSIPEQLAVIGYNNSILAECVSPKLTSLESNVSILSELTAKNIEKYFAGQEIQANYTVPFELIRRASF